MIFPPFLPFPFLSSCLVDFLADKSLINSQLWRFHCSLSLSFSFVFLLNHFHFVWPSSSVLSFCSVLLSYLLYPLLYFVLVSFMSWPVHFAVSSYMLPNLFEIFFLSNSISIFCILYFNRLFLGVFGRLFFCWRSELSWPLHVTVCYSDWGLCSLSSFYSFSLVIYCPLVCPTSLPRFFPPTALAFISPKNIQSNLYIYL